MSGTTADGAQASRRCPHKTLSAPPAVPRQILLRKQVWPLFTVVPRDKDEIHTALLELRKKKRKWRKVS